MSTTIAQPIPARRPVTALKPRILDSRVPLDALPHVEVRDGQLVVVFPSTCRWNEAERAEFVTKLRAAAEDSVKRARLRLAAAKDLI